MVDRLLQQTLHQVMQPIFEPTFSEGRYGFLAGRSARQAVMHAASYIRGGKRRVVAMELERFFGRVNHDALMHRAAKRIEDGRSVVERWGHVTWWPQCRRSSLPTWGWIRWWTPTGASSV